MNKRGEELKNVHHFIDRLHTGSTNTLSTFYEYLEKEIAGHRGCQTLIYRDSDMNKRGEELKNMCHFIDRLHAGSTNTFKFLEKEILKCKPQSFQPPDRFFTCAHLQDFWPGV